MRSCNTRSNRFCNAANARPTAAARVKGRPTTAGHAKTKSPELEVSIALPKWAIGGDLLCWIGPRRCVRPGSIAQMQGELWDVYRIQLSEDSLARHLRHYPVMLAARQEDRSAMRQQYAGTNEIILSIDGVQMEEDSHAREQLRKKVHGVWKIEQAVLKQQKAAVALPAAADAESADAASSRSSPKRIGESLDCFGLTKFLS